MLAKLGVAHLFSISFEVFRLGGEFVSEFRPLDGHRAKDRHNRFDVAVFELIDDGGRPLLAGSLVTGKQQLGNLVKVFTGVVEVHDENSSGKLLEGKIPDPEGAIAENHFDFGAGPASLKSLPVDAAAKFLGGLDGAGVGGGIEVANRVAFLIHAGGCEDTAQFYFARAGRLAFYFAGPAYYFFFDDVDASTVDLHIEDGNRSAHGNRQL